MSPITEVSDLRALRSRPRRLLSIFPHPDDEAYGCAGALARLAAEPDGAAVHFCLTKGTASSMAAERGMTPGEVGDMRVARMHEVGRILGLQGLLMGDLPDGSLARVHFAESTAAVREVIEAFDPQVVIAHDPRGVNAHADHIASHWILRGALTGLPSRRIAMVAYLQEAVDAIAPRLLFATPEEEIDAVLHLTPEETRKKEACLRVHEALVTLDPKGDPGLLYRRPVERYDFLGESLPSPVSELFADLVG